MMPVFHFYEMTNVAAAAAAAFYGRLGRRTFFAV
jgi:hypothetical protein